VAQVNAMTNGLPTSTKPLVSVSYNALRGAADGVPVISWPGTGYAVAPGSLIARLRTRTGFEAIDLPTFAQWEYACRAETTSYYYDGESTSDPVYTNVLKTLAWYLDNSSNTLQPVGGKWPNAWGLYDMLGNALEWQLDWYVPSMSDYASVDPVGSETGADRIRRSGSYAHDRTWARCGHYINFAPASTGPWLGFRVAVPLK
jgi:formylglycine-generating enzyme required for sulfatase activity